jgi:hypothetical protein
LLHFINLHLRLQKTTAITTPEAQSNGLLTDGINDNNDKSSSAVDVTTKSSEESKKVEEPSVNSNEAAEKKSGM